MPRSTSRSSCSALFLLACIALEASPRAQALSSPRRARIPVVRRVPAEHPTIQDAIDAARDGDVVLVRRGTYAEHVDFLGKAIEVVGNEGALRTTIAPTTDGAVVRFHRGEGPDSRLIGFTIRDGTTDPQSSAGGVSCQDPDTGIVSAPSLSDCIIEHNFASQDYGGLGPAGVSGNAILERCILRDNHSSISTAAGGAQGRLTLVQCVVEDNEGCGAGGLWLTAGSHVLDSVIRGNRAEACGGPLHTAGGGIRTDGPVVIEGSLLFDNVVRGLPSGEGFGGCSGQSRGGALSGDALLERCTIVGNGWETCATIGGIEGNPALVDCILYANEDPAGYYAGQFGMRYSDVQGGAAGAGSFDLFPELVDPSAGNLRLGPSSPCIDRGNPQSRRDADGTRADLGALYHPQGSAPLGVVWREEAPLVAVDADEDPMFGTSVAASGDTLLVGSSVGGLPLGAVRVLRRQGSEWTETQRLESGVPDDEFGWSVTIEGDIAAIGAIGYFGPGSVHVYERDSPAAPFEPSAVLEPGPLGRFAFGASLALDGDILVVGDQDREALAPGRAHVYQRLARGHWRHVAYLSPPEVDSWLYPQFGAAVDIDGRTLVVGAPMFGDADTYFGAVYVYERAGASPWSWVLARTLYPSGPLASGQFGRSLSLVDDTLLIGSRFGPTVFERGGPGLPWREAQVFTPSAGPPGYGSNVLLRENRAWITMPAQNTTQPAALWEFSRANAGAPWYEVARVALPAGAFSSFRAHALACSENSLFLGSATAEKQPAVRRLTRGPQVDAIQRDQAADQEPLVITGERLDEVSAVLLDGVAEPIVAQTPSELVIRPARRAPGFSDLALTSAGGSLTLPGRFESLPTLRATSTGAGGTLEVTLENGGPGAFALFFAFELRAAPLGIANPPTWHALELQMDRGRSGRLALDAFTASGRRELVFLLPSDPALLGTPFHLQAWCQRGLTGPLRYSFSNSAEASF